jgi:hypothetical protein
MGLAAVKLLNLLLCEPPRPHYSLRQPVVNVMSREAALQQALLRPLQYGRGLVMRLCQREVGLRC